VGLRETLTIGTNVTAALAVLVVSAALVAVTMTVCGEVSKLGAVYKPLLETVPTAGLSDQVTAVFVLPATDAVNCRLCAAMRLALEGVTETVPRGFSAIMALPGEPPLALAVTVTVCDLETRPGAVYKPALEMLPT
jgi:hypothetical protein